MVVRKTASFGTVTLDHAAHLARRSPCASCHGPGRAGPIAFTAKAAHAACRGCHVAEQKGPTECRGCHVVAAEPGATVALPRDPSLDAEPAAEAPATTPAEPTPVAPPAPPAPPPPSPAPGPAATAAEPSPAAGVAAPEVASVAQPVGPVPGAAGAPATTESALPAPPPPPPAPPRKDRSFSAALSPMVTAEGWTISPSFTLVDTDEDFVLAHTATVGLTKDSRTQFLIGAGRAWPLGHDVWGAVVGLGGVDAVQRPPSMSPAVGIRGGIDWRIRSPYVQQLGISLTVVADLFTLEGDDGRHAGRFSAALGLAGGFQLPR